MSERLRAEVILRGNQRTLLWESTLSCRRTDSVEEGEVAEDMDRGVD